MVEAAKTPTPAPAAPQKKSSLGRAVVWMLVLSLLLFWLPVLGMFIAGLVGGRKAGSLGTAVLAALLPAILAAGFMALFATLLTGFPLLGAVAGFGTGALVGANVVPLIGGAVVGGLLS